jgi:hypothetical protein
MLTSFTKGHLYMFFWSAGQTGFYGTIRKISGRDIRDRDYLKKIRDGTNGTGQFKNISGRDNKKVCPAGL